MSSNTDKADDLKEQLLALSYRAVVSSYNGSQPGLIDHAHDYAEEILALIESAKQRWQIEASAEYGHQIAEWLKYEPDLFGKSCNQCGGPMMVVRAAHPGGETRLLCPTCLDDIRRDVISNLTSQAAKSQLTAQGGDES